VKIVRFFCLFLEEQKPFMTHRTIKLIDLYNNVTSIDFPDEEITILFDSQEFPAPFNNKTFICEKLIFEHINNFDYNFYFYDCTFKCEVEFNNCNFEELSFKNTKEIRSLTVNGKNEVNKAKINSFRFYNEENLHNDQNPKPQLTTNFYFSYLIIPEVFSIENIDHIAGIFEFNQNDLSEKGNQEIRFKNTNFSNANFISNTFKSKTNFINTSFKYDLEHLKPARTRFEHTKFYDNTFEKVNFSKSKFDNLIEFDKCDFLSKVWFEECKDLNNSHLKFVSCKFEKYSLFDNSKLNKIEILRSKFLEKASFENFETNYFKIHQVTFAESAYFDDINKNNNSAIENWDRKTLRAIKRELVNTHNQIDYLRFKAYELEAFKKEKGKSWKDNTILKLNSYSSKNGLDWFRGFLFTIFIGFIFYLLYLCTYAVVMKKTVDFPNSVEDFFVGYLKFLNPFSLFKSPIQDAEIYFFPLFFFMFGKIFISYGIFQTVQAFRKFGVNGG
jgi:uncharacterized protein YjbI with pentapeptide repeats